MFEVPYNESTSKSIATCLGKGHRVLPAEECVKTPEIWQKTLAVIILLPLSLMSQSLTIDNFIVVYILTHLYVSAQVVALVKLSRTDEKCHPPNE